MKRIIELSDNEYKALKEDGVQNHLALADSIIAHSVPYEERPTGHWEKTGPSMYQCSHCGAHEEINFAKFCWLCGADMRESARMPFNGKVNTMLLNGKEEKTLTEAFMEDVNTDEVDYNELCYRTGHHMTMCDCELCDHRHECSGYEGDDDDE